MISLMVWPSKRTTLLVLFLIAMGVIAAGAYLHWSPSHEADFEKIADGMTYAQVVKILGVEPGNHRRLGGAFIFDEPFRHHFVDKLGQPRIVYRWYFDEGHAEIFFDKNQQVVLTIWNVAPVPPPTLWEQLRSRVGID